VQRTQQRMPVNRCKGLISHGGQRGLGLRRRMKCRILLFMV
jgi:hypothetical protein